MMIDGAPRKIALGLRLEKGNSQGGRQPRCRLRELYACARRIGAAKTLPAGFGEWTDTSFQEKRAEGKTTMILGFALLFAYLFSVGLYESWSIPVPVLLSVSVGVLGSFIAMALAGLTWIFMRKSAWWS
jgi:multidrug efflux pump subunit AcrB